MNVQKMGSSLYYFNKGKKMRQAISISMDKDLIDEVDERRGNMPRSQYIELLIFGLLYKEESGEGVQGYA